MGQDPALNWVKPGTGFPFGATENGMCRDIPFGFWFWSVAPRPAPPAPNPKPQTLKSQPNAVCGCEVGKLSFLLLFFCPLGVFEGREKAEGDPLSDDFGEYQPQGLVLTQTCPFRGN